MGLVVVIVCELEISWHSLFSYFVVYNRPSSVRRPRLARHRHLWHHLHSLTNTASFGKHVP